MSTKLIVDLHSIHVLGFARIGADAALCHYQREPDENDTFHFLHTAGLIALASEVHYAHDSWTGTQFAPRSQLAVEYLRSLDVSTLRGIGASPNERVSIAEHAGTTLARGMPRFCSPQVLDTVSNRVPVGQGVQETQATIATRNLLSGWCSEDERMALHHKFLDSPNNTSLLMLTTSPDLYEAIHKRFWPSFQSRMAAEDIINRLETLLRLYTYTAFASMSGFGSWFSPAFDRLSRWRDESGRWAESAQPTWARATRADEFPIVPGHIPALLLRRSGGDPDELLRLAAAFRRDHSQIIDACLPGALTAHLGNKDDEGKSYAERLTKELAPDLRDKYVDTLAMALDRFLAANGVTIMGPTLALESNRQTLIKGTLSDEKCREIVASLPEFRKLANRIRDGKARIITSGRTIGMLARKRIEADPVARRLAAAIHVSSPTIVMGTGVTIFGTGDTKYSWQGVVDHGLARAAEDPKWRSLIGATRTLLESTPASSIGFRIAGDVIREALTDNEWNTWLRELFAKPPVVRRDLFEALGALSRHCGLRLATTNYDTLFEAATSRTIYDAIVAEPHDAALVDEFFDYKVGGGGGIQRVFHIHGVYHHPDSVILGNLSYGSLTADTKFGSIVRLYESPLLFVGFSGLDDPTFARLRDIKAARKYAAGNFILLRREEAERASRGEGLPTVVTYGDSFDDLPPFLDAIREMASVS